MTDDQNIFGLKLGPGGMLMIGILAGAGGGKGMDIIYPPAPDRFTGSQARSMEVRLNSKIDDAETHCNVEVAEISAEIAVHKGFSERKVQQYDREIATVSEQVRQLQREVDRLRNKRSGP